MECILLYPELDYCIVWNSYPWPHSYRPCGQWWSVKLVNHWFCWHRPFLMNYTIVVWTCFKLNFYYKFLKLWNMLFPHGFDHVEWTFPKEKEFMICYHGFMGRKLWFVSWTWLPFPSTINFGTVVAASSSGRFLTSRC